MGKNKLIVMGIDHGNGYFKGYSNEVNGFVLPSSFLTKESAQKEDATGIGLIKYNEFESSQYTGEHYVWGKEINSATGRVLSTYTTEDRYSLKHYKLLSQFGLASLVKEKEGDFEVLLITGCPSREKGTKREVDLAQVYTGKHIVRMNGYDKIIHVKECKILPQPLGSVLDLYIDDQGNIEWEEIAESYIGIIDIGAGTTDCDGIESLKAVPEDRHTIPVGVHEIYQRLADYINSENPDANATPKKVEMQFQSDVYQASRRLSVPMKEAKERIVRETAEYIMNEIQTRWKNRSKFDMIILTGGGVHLMGSWFRQFIPDIAFVVDYQIANARGFLKFGLLLSKDYEATERG